MATFASIASPVGGSTASAATADQTGSLTTGTGTAEIVLGPFQMFAFNANGDINIRFGNAGMPAAAATDFRVPGGVVATYQCNRQHTSIRLFNATAGTVTWWIQPLTVAS